MKGIPLFFILLSFPLLQLSLTSKVEILHKDTYEEFINRHSRFFLTICDNIKSPKCQNIKTLIENFSSVANDEMKLDYGYGFMNTQTLEVLKLADKYIYEGFPTIFYIDRNDDESEPYFGSTTVQSLVKFIKKKMLLTMEEIGSENELKKILEQRNPQTALLLAGNINKFKFNYPTIAKAAKLSGFDMIFNIKTPEFLQQNGILDDGDLIVYQKEKSIYKGKRLNIMLEGDLEVKKLRNILLLNLREDMLFHQVSEFDLELALDKDITTLIFIYDNKKHLTNKLENEMNELALKYSNEINFIKATLSNHLIKKLNIKEYFNLDKNSLPALLLFGENPFNEDDVEKFVYTLPKNVTQEANSTMPIHSEINLEVIEDYISKYTRGQLNKVLTTANYYEIKMEGENFIQVMQEEIDNDHEVLLLLCPMKTKKYDRIKARFERLFNKIFKANDKVIGFDEIDPFLNEVSYISYKYIPTAVLLQKNTDKISSLQPWKLTYLERNFTTSNLTNFIAQHSKFSLNQTTLDDEEKILIEEAKGPLYPVHKKRFEGTQLNEYVDKQTVGLKRRWKSLKLSDMIKLDKISKFADKENEFEESGQDYEEFDNPDENEYAPKTDL